MFTIKNGDFGAISEKADLAGTIFAYHYRAQLAYVMTSRQIVSCKLTNDIRTTHVDVVSENSARVDGRKS